MFTPDKMCFSLNDVDKVRLDAADPSLYALTQFDILDDSFGNSAQTPQIWLLKCWKRSWTVFAERCAGAIYGNADDRVEVFGLLLVERADGQPFSQIDSFSVVLGRSRDMVDHHVPSSQRRYCHHQKSPGLA